jgi:hypothetical protein
MDKENGKRIMLPKGICALRGRDHILIGRVKNDRRDSRKIAAPG